MILNKDKNLARLEKVESIYLMLTTDRDKKAVKRITYTLFSFLFFYL